MQKRPFIVLVLLISFSWLHATENENFSITIEPYFGLMNGSIHESVTYFNNNERCYESLLTWDIENIKVYGTEINLELSKYFNINFSYLQGKSSISGFMQDYDWLNPFTQKWINDPSDELTNYSKHTNTLNAYSKFLVGGGIIFHLLGKITLIPAFKLNSEFIKLTGSNGFKDYKSDNHEIKRMYGDIISYQQQLTSLLFGSELKIECIPYTLIQLNFYGAFTNLEAYDSHIFRKVLFNDKIYGFFSLESSAKIYFLWQEKYGIGLKGSIQYFPEVFGADWSNSIDAQGVWEIAENAKFGQEYGGSSRFLWQLGLTAFFRF